jgi:uncharacterized OB-fold protein
MAERKIPDPNPNPETEAFWEAAKQGKFLLRYCGDCGKTHWYPRAICPHCFSDNTEWREASGRGTIYTYSVVRRTDPQYAIAYVTLEEGPTMISNIVDCSHDDLAVGQSVEVTFKQSEGGFAVPMFTPTG